MKEFGVLLVIVVIIAGITYGGYQIKRAWNYSWGYESKVQWEICDMIKPEALKDPERCE